AFWGNSNADSVVMHKLQHPVIARFLRILPLNWNPNGRIGLRLEAYGCQHSSAVVGLDGGARLLFRPDLSEAPADRDVLSFSFKSLQSSGLLLQMESSSGHTVALELLRGKLLLQIFRAQLAVAETVVSVGSLLDDQHWHQVVMEQLHSGFVNLTVDKNTQKIQLPDIWTHTIEINQ
ncbi:hypothetical protein DNTS_003143, partial [Danionella cerebrum]